MNLRNSIIANNGAEDLVCAGSAVTISASLIENNDSDCPAATYSDDPQLDGLTGSPAYFPLGYDSPAIGVGDATYCTASDQRGQARPQPAGTLCDIGAYERRTLRVTATAGPSPTNTASPSPTNTPVPANIMVNANCSLPDAITAANDNSNSHNSNCVAGTGHDIITLPAGETTTLSRSLKHPLPNYDQRKWTYARRQQHQRHLFH